MRALLVCIGWLACAAWAAERQTVPTEASRHEVDTATELSQYGITWKFDRPRVLGRFVTGDYWVLGPVRIVAVTPEPGPAPEDDKTEVRKNQFGDAGLQDDRRMRNGSMIVMK